MVEEKNQKYACPFEYYIKRKKKKKIYYTFVSFLAIQVSRKKKRKKKKIWIFKYTDQKKKKCA
jgi:hypothetical protein